MAHHRAAASSAAARWAALRSVSAVAGIRDRAAPVR